MSLESQKKRTVAVLNVLGKWRKLLAGWQLGTRSDTDPEAAAVRDHREVTLILRAEVNALAALLMKKGVFTEEEFYAIVELSAGQLCLDLEERFPGVTASSTGLTFDSRVGEWMRPPSWLP